MIKAGANIFYLPLKRKEGFRKETVKFYFKMENPGRVKLANYHGGRYNQECCPDVL